MDDLIKKEIAKRMLQPIGRILAGVAVTGILCVWVVLLSVCHSKAVVEDVGTMPNEVYMQHHPLYTNDINTNLTIIGNLDELNKKEETK